MLHRCREGLRIGGNVPRWQCRCASVSSRPWSCRAHYSSRCWPPDITTDSERRSGRDGLPAPFAPCRARDPRPVYALPVCPIPSHSKRTTRWRRTPAISPSARRSRQQVFVAFAPTRHSPGTVQAVAGMVSGLRSQRRPAGANAGVCGVLPGLAVVPKVYPEPMSIDKALARVGAWMSTETVLMIVEQPNHRRMPRGPGITTTEGARLDLSYGSSTQACHRLNLLPTSDRTDHMVGRNGRVSFK